MKNNQINCQGRKQKVFSLVLFIAKHSDSKLRSFMFLRSEADKQYLCASVEFHGDVCTFQRVDRHFRRK